VTIIARNKDTLISAKNQILQSSGFGSSSSIVADDTVGFEVADVCKEAELKEAIKKACEERGNVDWIVCNAGEAKTGLITSLEPKVFKEQMDLNYQGVVNTTLTALPYLLPSAQAKTETKPTTPTKPSHLPNKKVIIVSSAMGLVSFAGYLPYAPTKWALRGFAEGLRHELVPYNIGVHIFYASAMDTPGYKQENIGKPLITKRIEQGALFSPQQAAQHLFDGIRRNEMGITSEYLMEFLRMSIAGISPANNFPLQLLLTPFTPLISAYVKNEWDSLIKRFHNEHK